MKSASVIVLLGALAALRAAFAGPLGEHPAVLQKRAAASAGYDYASKFYPHPAWLYMRPSEETTWAQAVPTNRDRGETVSATESGSLVLTPAASLGETRLAAGSADRAAIFYRPLRRRRAD